MPPALRRFATARMCFGFSGNINIPQTSKFVATRLDHDFSAKWHFNATYHFYKLTTSTTDQVEHRRLFPGRHEGCAGVLVQ